LNQNNNTNNKTVDLSTSWIIGEKNNTGKKEIDHIYPAKIYVFQENNTKKTLLKPSVK